VVLTRLVLVSSLLAATVACGKANSPIDPAPNGPSVSIPTGAEFLGKLAFAPDDLTVDAGATVTWTNTDSVTHTSTSDGAGWNSGNIAPGGHFSAMFSTPGTFSYHCTIHPGMIGTVTVR